MRGESWPLSASLPKPDHCRQSGFTLLELLLALTLLVVLSGTLYGSYFALVKGRESAEAGMEARRELRTTLDQVRRQLSSILFRSNDKRLRFVVEDRDMYGKPCSTLSFTAIASPYEGEAISDQIDVTYRVLEREGKMVLASQEKDLRLIGEAPRYPQMEQLEGFLVECFNGEKWVKSWDTAINLNLPKAVRVTFTVMEDGNPVQYSIVTTPRIVTS